MNIIMRCLFILFVILTVYVYMLAAYFNRSTLERNTSSDVFGRIARDMAEGCAKQEKLIGNCQDRDFSKDKLYQVVVINSGKSRISFVKSIYAPIQVYIYEK
ncbi:hypothetical protein SAMN00790413_03534 [Deinococcus hopiensis KR-140]|uniref:Uncharacterized protein n=1 Tax=Deinococcus hopiensis KR-140 TaxID=695939 RepID=A0A1W1UXG7_9DEIO|nr:hypothetical protein SAMN00790413_03534 [Deinococcus hopiensis KR-140]